MKVSLNPGRLLRLPRFERRDEGAGCEGHVTFALVSLALVAGTFATEFAAVAEVARGLRLLSTTTIVFLFVVGWLLLWLGLELVWTCCAPTGTGDA